jgi:zinc D-Ala-D-Ala carboxypeptidase
MNLTQNFTLSEMTKSETALRFGMANDPSETEIENMRLLCENVLQKVRDYYGMGVKVNSGFRHPLVNAKVNGSTTSDHCKGFAADIEIPGIPNADLAQWIADNCEFRQLILEFYTPGVPPTRAGYMSPTTLRITKSRCSRRIKKTARRSTSLG